MASIKVYAHHLVPPIPPSLTVGYPPWPPVPVPPQPPIPAQGALPWPSGAGSAGPIVAWCELAREIDVHDADFAGPTWPGPQPQFEDGSYSSTAVGFKVTRLRIINPTNLAAGVKHHEYTFRDPTGAVVAVLTPVGGNPATFAKAVFVADGKGLWTIEIRRLASSSTGTPGLLTGPPGPTAVGEPFIGMFGPNVEEALRIEFEGEEIPPPRDCITSVTLKAEVESSPGSGVYGPVTGCIPVGTNVRFTATPSSSGAGGVIKHKFSFGDGTATAYAVTNPVFHVYTTASVTPITARVDTFQAGTECDPVYAETPLTIGCCPTGTYWDNGQKGCVKCPTVLTAAASNPSGCAPGSVGVTLTATSAGVVVTSYSWAIDGPPGTSFRVTRPSASAGVDTSGGWTGTGTSPGSAVVFPVHGTYTVSVTAKLAGDAATCDLLQASTSFVVAECPTKCKEGEHWDTKLERCVPDEVPPPKCKDGEHWDAKLGRCEPDVITPPITPPTTSPSCGVLLVLSIVLLLLGALVVIIGVCIAVPVVWIIGAAIGTIGLLLFVLWIFLCSAVTACSLMITMHCILFWIVAVVAPVLLAVAAFFGGLPCALAVAAAWGGWGALYAWLGFIMRRVGCTPTC